ncbi:MAG: SWIM zinc finger family protein [Microscillaceae bacterium]|nr:SWIM zinc finger family protein [Microscillaceae bacterium]
MQVTQSYTRPSTSTVDSQGMKFDFSAELSRPPVSINALIKNSLAYARIMLALRQVVKGDWRSPQKDHSAYQEWVMERYLEELPEHLKGLEAEKALLLEKREKLKIRQKNLKNEIDPIQKEINKARMEYYQWLYKHDREKWIVLDPVISVHPDAVIFEAFSLDESSYGRVSVPADLLETFGEVQFGTTNIDFSQALADEIYRVRSYRPAWLKVAFEKVELSTAIGSNVEKKIDLPESWVRGFLQVQSAATLEGIDLELDTQTVADVLSELERKKEKVSPRSIRFLLKKDKNIKIILDPWNIEIIDSHIYQGDQEGEIRLWGRRRLFVLKDLLPYSEKVYVKLLGTGMPSYWTIEMDGHRFDLGLSGWTDNDWAKKGNFDLLASSGNKKNIDMNRVEHILQQKLATSPQEVAEILKVERSAATFALQELAKNGQAMYDHLKGTYRWRQLLKQDIKITETEDDERLKYAVGLVKDNHVEILSTQVLENQHKEFQLAVQAKDLFKPTVQLDLDGRIKFADCSCSFHRRNQLRQGPCPHIMASVIYISRYS